METKEYLEYLKSFDNDEVNKYISLYENKKIVFGELEQITLKHNYLTIRCYYKKIKIDNILNKLKKG